MRMTEQELADLRSYALSRMKYDPITGSMTWLNSKVKNGSRVIPNRDVGTIDSKGYRQVRLRGKAYLVHRVAWLMLYGEWPRHLDHIDRDPLNNAISNLRECDHFENHQNTGVRKDNTSGVTGVSFNKKCRLWQAYINVQGVRHRIGHFEKFDDAVAARIAAKAEIHTFHPHQNNHLA